MENLGVRGGVGRGWRSLSITPNQHGICRCTTIEQLQVEVLLGFLGKSAIQLGAPLPALYCSGGKATPGLLCQVSTNGVLLIPTLDLKGDSVDGFHRP